MGRYQMGTGKDDILGEGTSSVCYSALDVRTGNTVAIKVYKSCHVQSSVSLQKFKRQVHVLQELQTPFEPSADPQFWHPRLAEVCSSHLFMQMLDFSKDAKGEPGPDTHDGVMYVVTEIAQYSLDDLIKEQRRKHQAPAFHMVKQASQAVILIVAGLHAKGFVHLDLKPENLMIFDGSLKLIDVDGCVRSGVPLSINDSSISFSPCFCAPEWARFLVDGQQQSIIAMPALDVWSVGMTIASLVALDATMKSKYVAFVKEAKSSKEGGFFFMEWLGSLVNSPVPEKVGSFDPDLADLLANHLLVCDASQRTTLADCLSHPFINLAKPLQVSQEPPPTQKRAADLESKAPVIKGTLWKLNQDGDPANPLHWLRRDMWITVDGKLCYYSIKTNRRVILVDGSSSRGLRISRVAVAAKGHAFKVRAISPVVTDVVVACDSSYDYGKWTTHLTKSGHSHRVPTMRLGGSMALEFSAIRLAVKNRRQKVKEGTTGYGSHIFKAKLWKLDSNGDRQQQTCWREREMWLSQNGSLVYWSPKDGDNLVYYNALDVARSQIRKLVNGTAARPWAFQLQLPDADGVNYAPAEFAAESDEMREHWVSMFGRCKL